MPGKVVAIVQARMGSTRLPGKVMMDICGKPMLQHVVERAAMAKQVDEVWVATTFEERDYPIHEFCAFGGWKYWNGSEHDVLKRYVHTARQAAADVVVRITADCPLIDPVLIDDAVLALEAADVDYASNMMPPRRYPLGLAVEAMTNAALNYADREATEPHEREHVTPYFYAGESPMQWAPLRYHTDYSFLRWTVDTEADLCLVRLLMHAVGDSTSWLDALDVMQAHPEWVKINAHIKQKGVTE